MCCRENGKDLGCKEGGEGCKAVAGVTLLLVSRSLARITLLLVCPAESKTSRITLKSYAAQVPLVFLWNHFACAPYRLALSLLTS
jgi:hypothetical protein